MRKGPLQALFIRVVTSQFSRQIQTLQASAHVECSSRVNFSCHMQALLTHVLAR